MRSLVIKCTAGAEDAERCNQAFTVAAAAVAAGAEVSLWLTGEAAWFGVPGRAEEFELDLATPLAELRDIVLAGGSGTRLRPITLGIYQYIGNNNQEWNAIMATAAVASVPATILLVLAQRYIASGVTTGAVKD